MFEAEVPNQGIVLGTIVEIQDNSAIIFYGHPLAGKTIKFEVEIISAKDASDEDVKRLMKQYQG